MTLQLSMSALERAIECTASLLLPQSPTQGAWASYGHVVHAFLQRVPQMGRDAAIAAAPKEHRDALESIELDAILTLSSDGFAHEVAIAMHLHSGVARELGRGVSRDEAYRLRRPGEIVGTLDVLGVTEDSVIVVDYKSGFRDLGPVKENWQLRGYAFLACALYGKRKAIVGIIRPGALEPYFDHAVLGDIDLDIIEDELRSLYLRYEAMAREPDPYLLPTKQNVRWCEYCPAYDFCPGKRGLPAQAVDENLPDVPQLNADVGGRALERVELVEQWAKKARARINEYADRAPIPLAGGLVYGPRTLTQRPIIVEKGLQLLVAELGEDVRKAVTTEQRLTKADLTRLVQKRVAAIPKADRPKVRDEVERVMALLDAAGALGRKPVTRYERHKPANGALAQGEADEAATG